jgi:hypothetical protein
MFEFSSRGVIHNTACPNPHECLFAGSFSKKIMGKQHNKEIKRRRRNQLLKRRKEAVKLAKATPGLRAKGDKKAAAKKPAAKKPAAKKAKPESEAAAES